MFTKKLINVAGPENDLLWGHVPYKMYPESFHLVFSLKHDTVKKPKRQKRAQFI